MAKKEKTLTIDCKKLTKRKFYYKGAMCLVGHYLAKIEGIDVESEQCFALMDRKPFKERAVLYDILTLNDNDYITWKEKIKEVRPLFKRLKIKVIFRNQNIL